MDKKEKLQMLRKLSEADLTKNFLIPLYESDGMGCKSVRYTHTTLEFGKDIVYYKDDEYGNRVYTGIQVKKTKITARNIADILRQTTEAFGEPFTDLSDGKKKDLDRFVVLTSNGFSEPANKSFRASLRGAKLDKLVTCIEGNQLVGLLEKHMPSAFWDEYDYFNRYFNAMKKDFTTIKDISAIGQTEPVSLEEIYVSLRLSEEKVERALPAEEEWKIFAEKVSGRESEEIEKRIERARILDPERAVKDYDRLVIVGDPGSGKTTLLKYLVIKSCRENLEKQERTCIPIPITLRQLAESGKSLRAYIDKVFEKYEFPKAKKFVEKDLKEGRCRLLLDGFDELTTKESREKIASEIQKFAKKYRKSQLVASTRPAGYNDELEGFTKVEVLEFDDKQIEKFIENWFGQSEPEKANLMFEAIKRNEQIKTLSRNPLRIAIIAIIYEEDRELPQRRTDLYKRCVEVLLSKWDVRKRIKNKYPSEKKEYILRKLAFYGHVNNKRILKEKEVTVEMLRHFQQIGLKQQDAKGCLDEIWQRSYLLRQISMTSYDFLHLSFQEYFTALELKEREDGLSMIIKHLDEPWWEEPILLYAGISRDASALIKTIREKVPEDIFYSNLLLFGKCIADAEFTEPSLRDKIVSELWSLYRRRGEFGIPREKAITVLGLIKPDKLIDSLIKNLEDQQSYRRCRSAAALGRIGSERAVEPLVKALINDQRYSVRGRAAAALGSIGSEKAIEFLVKALTTDTQMSVRRRAASALGSIGSYKVVEPLIKALTNDRSNHVRLRAVSAIGRIGSDRAIEVLVRTLTTDKDNDIRLRATQAIVSIGREKVIESLAKFLTINETDYVRRRVANTLGRIGSKGAIEPLINTLTTDKDVNVRWEATYALGRIGAEKSIEQLVKILTTDKDIRVRGSAAWALGCIGSEKGVKVLAKVLTTDQEISVRLNAVSALGRIASEQAIEHFLKIIIFDKSSFLRRKVVSALGHIGSEKTIEPIAKILATDKDNRVRVSAAWALGRIGSEEAIKPLVKAIDNEKESYVRQHLTSALGIIDSPNVFKPLIKNLSTGRDRYIRGRAASALGNLGSEKGLESLVKALKTDRSAYVRLNASIALGSIGSEKAIEPLKQALGDDGESRGEKVKDAAFTALEKISRRNSIRITRS